LRGLASLTKIYNKQNLYYQLKNNQRIILVAYEDKKPLGFAMIDEPYGGVSFLRWLAVDKNHQGKEKGLEKCGFEKEGLRKMSYFGINQVVMGKVIREFDVKKIV